MSKLVDEVREEWRTVPDYPGYQVSDHGNIKGPRRRGLMKLPITARGYHRIGLTNCEGRKDFFVHRLVLWAFTGEYKNGLHVAHFDGCKTNNHISNLRWATHAENMKDSVRLNQRAIGDRHGFTKLTENQVRLVRKLYHKEHKQKSNADELANRFGVCKSTIFNALYRRRNVV